MFIFENWRLSVGGSVLAYQYDNLSRAITVIGGLPEGWSWTMLVQYGRNEDAIPLTPSEGGAGAVLTADNLSLPGQYSFQLRGTASDGVTVRHTNVVQATVPASLTGNGSWPVVPTEFTRAERSALAAAARAEEAAAHYPRIGENGNWFVWDPGAGAFADTGRPAAGPQGAAGDTGLLTDQNSGRQVRVWFGTVAEYNALETIDPDVCYNILEGAAHVG